MSKNFVGIDIGGTHVRAVAFSDLSNPCNVRQVLRGHNPNQRSYEDDLNALIQTIREVARDDIGGIGLGLPGDIRADKTGIAVATYFPHWKDQPVSVHLSNAFNCPVKVEHDQVCSTLGEALYGGTTDRGFALVGLGTGMGGAFAEKDNGQTIIRSVQEIYEREYFDVWDKECGGFQISLEFGKPASDFDDNDWAIVMNRFKKNLCHYLSRPEITEHTIVFSGGVAVKQADRLLSACKELEFDTYDFRVVACGEYSGAYGAAALFREDYLVE